MTWHSVACRSASKAQQAAKVDAEAEGELSARESNSAGDDKPVRDIELRPRKRVSFNLDETASVEEASQVKSRPLDSRFLPFLTPVLQPPCSCFPSPILPLPPSPPPLSASLFQLPSPLLHSPGLLF